MKGIKKLLAAGLAGLLFTVPVGAEETTWEEIPNANIPAAVIQKEVAEAEGMQVALSLPVKSAILIDQNTGTVRYEMNADEKLPPASITKIMSLLLFMEALDSGKIALTDTVTCSEAAAGFGGSQIWLKPGEEMTVDDLLKAVAVQSANDATVCLAEYVAGSEEAFVQLMNQKAAELGMENTHFACCAGLDNEGHYSTARDIALMSRALLRYPNHHMDGYPAKRRHQPGEYQPSGALLPGRHGAENRHHQWGGLLPFRQCQPGWPGAYRGGAGRRQQQ